MTLFLAGCHLPSCQRGKSPLLRVHIESEPTTLNPYLATGMREYQILQSLHEGLTRYHPETLKPLPGVAKSWHLSEDQRTYTFHLRTDAKWSDGRSVTAQDFYNGWEHLLNTATAAPYASLLHILKGGREYASGKAKGASVLGMKVKGTWVFEVTLEEPVPYFLTLTSFAALAPLRKTEGVENFSVFNGPFQLSPRKKEEGILLTPNPFYWGKHEVRLSGVLFRPFGDFRTALKYYNHRGIDIMADLPPAQVPLLKFRSDFRNDPVLRVEYFIVNVKHPPLDQKVVRQALARALDRRKITDEILKKGDLPYSFFVPPGIPGYRNPETALEHSTEAANALLAESGLAPDSLRPLQVNCDRATDRHLVASAAMQMWESSLGLKMRMEEDDWSAYQNKRARGDFDLLWGGWYGDYLDPKTFLELFVSGSRQNHTGWNHPDYDALMASAETAHDRKERMELYRRAEAILLEEAAVIPVLVKTKTYLIQHYVRGYTRNLLDIHPFRDIHREP